MTDLEIVFQESAATPKLDEVPLSHLSIELGHLYMEDFKAGYRRLVELFARVRPWAQAAEEVCRAQWGPKARISTCFLVDDYFSPFGSPAELVPLLQRAAAESNLVIDYLARESACASAGDVEPARLVEGRLVAEPPRQANGSRPPVTETGWLSNGERSPHALVAEAMEAVEPWRPPRQNLPNNHSIFMDVELWDAPRGERRWSCPMLAAVWQLLRLGLLRHEGQAVAVPQHPSDPLGATWQELPPVLRLRPDARPFFAYRTFSALSTRFLPIEGAVRAILDQVSVDPAVNGLAIARAADEGRALSADILDRIDYAFVNGASAPLR
ncbi:SCO2522 family protein [Catellatospora sichuanensis]|uniref:SCO2522 family protein n=1 Tax=Catellatospora sichuanensis TaxID=1969805 RepID=UPI0011832374|nr:SCO2522 family protein [Catellatospora sichuanensis]